MSKENTQKPSKDANQKTELTSASVPPKKASRLRFDKSMRNKLLTAIVILVLAGVSFYFYNKSRQAELELSDSSASSQQAINQVVKKIGKHMVLPTDEQPTLATVSDVTKVSDQPFFTHAKNGDKVLVYTQARKAILYRPDIDRIIEVSPLSVNSVQQSSGLKK